MAKVHAAWRYTLNWIAIANGDLRMVRLQNDILGPNRQNSAELAVKLEQGIADYLPESQYGRREQLCGGRDETGNGFAMWRRLFRENRGSGEVIGFAGIELLRKFNQCKKIQRSVHIWTIGRKFSTHTVVNSRAPQRL